MCRQCATVSELDERISIVSQLFFLSSTATLHTVPVYDSIGNYFQLYVAAKECGAGNTDFGHYESRWSGRRRRRRSGCKEICTFDYLTEDEMDKVNREAKSKWEQLSMYL